VANKCDADLQHADNLVRQMDVEARMESSSALRRAVADAKKELKQLRDTRERVRQLLERQELFGGGGSGSGGYMSLSDGARQDRGRFEQVTARMDRSSEALLESRRVLAETEEVAMGITENLASNRSTMERLSDRLNDAGGLLGSAGQILRRMRWNETRRKAILAFLIVFLVVMVILMLSWAMSPSSASSANNPNHQQERRRFLRSLLPSEN
jgi:hypothetical protein